MYHLEKKDIPWSNIDECVVDDDCRNFRLTWTESENIEFHSASSVLFILNHNFTLTQHHTTNRTQDQQQVIRSSQWGTTGTMNVASFLESILQNLTIFLQMYRISQNRWLCETVSMLFYRTQSQSGSVGGVLCPATVNLGLISRHLYVHRTHLKLSTKCLRLMTSSLLLSSSCYIHARINTAVD